jgi:hypothetical protein
MAGYYSALFSQLAFKFFKSGWPTSLCSSASFSILLELSGMAVALLRHPGGMKTLHFVTIFSNPDGRLHFVRRHLENFFLEYFWDGRRFAPASLEL